jgi:hypothetical protein
VNELLRSAFRTAPGREANEAIERVRREQSGEEGDEPRSYELVLTGWEPFEKEQLPKLVYHLESIGSHLPGCSGVFIAAFTGDELRFLHARDLLAEAGRMLGLSAEDLVERYGTGESRTAASGPTRPTQSGPKALLPPPGGNG